VAAREDVGIIEYIRASLGDVSALKVREKKKERKTCIRQLRAGSMASKAIRISWLCGVTTKTSFFLCFKRGGKEEDAVGEAVPTKARVDDLAHIQAAQAVGLDGAGAGIAVGADSAGAGTVTGM
jgi:hypothetical protein